MKWPDRFYWQSIAGIDKYHWGTEAYTDGIEPVWPVMMQLRRPIRSHMDDSEFTVMRDEVLAYLGCDYFSNEPTTLSEEVVE